MKRRKMRREPVEKCSAPDRHVPGLKCGYPLPCPYHTVVVVVDGEDDAAYEK